MPWERKTVEEQRREFAEAAKESKNFSALCREFGITRKTGYKWVERYKENTDLSDKSRKPFTIANRTPAETEERIVTKCGKPISKVNSAWQIITIAIPSIYLMTIADL